MLYFELTINGGALVSTGRAKPWLQAEVPRGLVKHAATG